MESRPFTSDCTNIFNEATFTSAPATFGINNVIVTQAQNRSIFDTISTSIAGNHRPQMSPSCSCNCNCGIPQTQTMHGQQEYIPGGVSFTFNPMAQKYALQGFSAIAPQASPQQLYQPNQFGHCPRQQMQQTYQQPLTLEQQITLKQLEREGLELLLVQEHLKKHPYQIQFHHNEQTSTSDLLNGPSQVPLSRGMPDFKNLSGIMRDIETIGQVPCDCPPSCLYPEVSKTRKLILTKSADVQEIGKPDSTDIFDDVAECTDSQMQEAGLLSPSSTKSSSHIKAETTKQVLFSDTKTDSSSKKKMKKKKRSKSHDENAYYSCSEESLSSTSTSTKSSEYDADRDEYLEDME